jgi:hypothetical protein
MFSRKVVTFALLLILFGFGNCVTPSPKEDTNTNNNSAKIPDDGYIRLVLNEKNGCFSLYYLSDPKTMSYEPLFNAEEPAASFLSVFVDNKVYKLGSSRKFKTRIERDKGDTSLIFESSFLKVTQIFSPVKTSSSQAANGVMITINIQNTATQRSFVGARMLLDTNLGEGMKKVPFLTNRQVVSSELLIEGNSDEKFWISRGKNTALMGSIVNPVDDDDNLSVGKGPDIVHIANWKRLKDAPWRLNYSQGRSFNNLPHSAGDSAVCYYFGPEMLDLNKVLSYTFFLTTEDTAWYNVPASAVAAAPVQKQEPVNQTYIPPVHISPVNIPAIEAQAQIEAEAADEDEDTIVLLKLQEILNQFIDGYIFLNEHDLSEIEKAIDRRRN